MLLEKERIVFDSQPSLRHRRVSDIIFQSSGEGLTRTLNYSVSFPSQSCSTDFMIYVSVADPGLEPTHGGGEGRFCFACPGALFSSVISSFLPNISGAATGFQFNNRVHF